MKNRILLIAAVLAAFYAVVVTWRETERAAGLDFYIYFVNAQVADHPGVDNIYSDDAHALIGEEFYARGQASDFDIWRFDSQRRRSLDSVSSPFLYTTFSWVSSDYRIALRQFHALAILAFVVGVLMIGRASGLPGPVSLFLLAALLLWYRGFEADLRVGNVNSLQLAAIGAALVTPPFAAGAILGMLLAFKPNILAVPLLVVVARVVARDWNRLRIEIAGGAAGGLAAFTIASIQYGSPRVWLHWIERAGEFYVRVPTRAMGNFTPGLFLYERYSEWVSYLIAALLFIAACAAIARSRMQNDPLIVGTGVLIYVMSALVVWPHYMVLPLAVAIPLLRHRGSAVAGVVAIVLLAEEPLRAVGIETAGDVRFIGAALAILFGAAAWRLGRKLDAHPSAVPR